MKTRSSELSFMIGFEGVVCEYIKELPTALETNYSLMLLNRFLLTVSKNGLKMRGDGAFATGSSRCESNLPVAG